MSQNLQSCIEQWKDQCSHSPKIFREIRSKQADSRCTAAEGSVRCGNSLQIGLNSERKTSMNWFNHLHKCEVKRLSRLRQCWDFVLIRGDGGEAYLMLKYSKLQVDFQNWRNIAPRIVRFFDEKWILRMENRFRWRLIAQPWMAMQESHIQGKDWLDLRDRPGTCLGNLLDQFSGKGEMTPVPISSFYMRWSDSFSS